MELLSRSVEQVSDSMSLTGAAATPRRPRSGWHSTPFPRVPGQTRCDWRRGHYRGRLSALIAAIDSSPATASLLGSQHTFPRWKIIRPPGSVTAHRDRERYRPVRIHRSVKLTADRRWVRDATPMPALMLERYRTIFRHRSF